MNIVCKHAWEFVPLFEDDRSFPSGKRDDSYWKCRDCPATTTKRPGGIELEYPGEDFIDSRAAYPWSGLSFDDLCCGAAVVR